MMPRWTHAVATVLAAACSSSTPPATSSGVSTPVPAPATIPPAAPPVDAQPVTVPDAAPPPVAPTKTVTVPDFGDVEIADGALLLIDHGTIQPTAHRVQAIVIASDFKGTKLSWADQPGPHADVKTEPFETGAEEHASITTWSKQLWKLAPKGQRVFGRAKPRYGWAQWAAVLRHGDEVRVVADGAQHEHGDREDLSEGLMDYISMHY